MKKLGPRNVYKFAIYATHLLKAKSQEEVKGTCIETLSSVTLSGRSFNSLYSAFCPLPLQGRKTNNLNDHQQMIYYSIFTTNYDHHSLKRKIINDLFYCRHLTVSVNKTVAISVLEQLCPTHPYSILHCGLVGAHLS